MASTVDVSGNTVLTTPPNQQSDDAHGYYTLGEKIADTKAPAGPIKDRWTTHKMNNRLVNPANRRKLATRTPRAGRTRSPRRAASTRRRTTRRTATRRTASSTTP